MALSVWQAQTGEAKMNQIIVSLCANDTADYCLLWMRKWAKRKHITQETLYFC